MGRLGRPGRLNNTTIESVPSFLPADGNPLPEADPYGRTIHFGIREHAMAATMNGIALHGNTRIYGGTFLVFSDYMRNAVRLSALMHLPVTYVWTHDSIGLGEDGPTHQPVEHLASLRAIPGLNVVRPADANETAIAWREILEHTRTAGRVALTRQTCRRSTARAPGRGRGQRRLRARRGRRRARPQVVLIGTGSEVQLAVEAREQLRGRRACRPGWCRCRPWSGSRSRTRRTATGPAAVREGPGRVEAGIGLTWHQFVGDAGRIVSLEHFGASAADKVLFREFGFTAEAVVAPRRARRGIARRAAAALTAHGRPATVTT